jgi:hypothetical protein
VIRKLVLGLAVLALAACAPTPADPAPTEQAATEQPAVEPATPAGFVGVDGKPLVMADGTIDNSVQEALTANPDACAKAGGALQPVCRMQTPICLINFVDAGKACTDGAQCGSGRCLAEVDATTGAAASGNCAATNDPCGCYQRIEDGVATAAICVD